MSNQVVPESSPFADIEDPFEGAVVPDDDQGIEWSEPPSKRGRGKAEVDYQEIADALRSQPGRWAKIATGSRNTSLVAQIKQGKLTSFQPEGTFEATSRRLNEAGDLAVWARYVGQ